MTRPPCVCRSFFGSDAHHRAVPTVADGWSSGKEFLKIWNAALARRYEYYFRRRDRPVWLDKSWQLVWNWIDRNRDHGIALHPDNCDTYNSRDPITSLAFGHGGVLTLGVHIGKPPAPMLFQEDGDVVMMAGQFQKEFCHGAPSAEPGRL